MATVVTQPTDDEITPTVSEEYTAMIAWRVLQLTNMHVGEAMAAMAAESGVDWHLVQDLIREGCDPAVAVNICL